MNPADTENAMPPLRDGGADRPGGGQAGQDGAATTGSQRGPTALAWWSAFCAVLAVLLLPLLLVQVPPLLDYPNHLARMFVLAHPDDPVLSRMYAVHWAVLPNMAMDLLIPPLMRVVPVYVAGKIMLAACLLATVTGAVAFSRALFRQRSYWQLLAGIVAYHGLFLMGFLNFCFSLGFALWLAARGWLRFRDTHPRAAVAGVAAGAVPLFFFHLFGLLFLGLLLVSLEAARIVAAWRRGAALPALAGSALRLGIVFAAPAILVAISPFAGAGGQVMWTPPRDKAIGIFTPFFAYVPTLDLLTALLVFGIGTLAVFFSPRSRSPLSTRLCLAGLVVAYAACPFAMKEGGFIDLRLPVMAGLVLFAGLAPRFPRRSGRIALAVLAGLFLTRMAVLDAVWLRSATDVALLREAIAPVPPGQRVLAVDMSEQDNPEYHGRMPRWRHIRRLALSYSHLPALLIIDRKAFWQGEFANPSQQPMLVQPAYQDAESEVGHVGTVRELVADPLPASVAKEAPYLVGWRDKFDYVLVENAGGLPDAARLLPQDLELLTGNDMAALYRIRKNAGRG